MPCFSVERHLWMPSLLAVVALLCPSERASAQGRDTASLFGSITDAQGAVAPGANVTITHTATNQARSAETDGSGGFVFSLLPIGTYTLAVELTGFQKYEQRGVLLQANENVRVEVQLQVGDIQTVVTVEALAAQVETRAATLKQTVDERRVLELPLNGRNPADLALLSPGVVPITGNSGDSRGVTTPRGTKRFSVNGSRQNNLRYTLDGGNNNDNLLDYNQPFPFPDAVQEFSVQTSNMGVEMGGKSGGSINVVTKSGTNEIHGSTFWFLRNSALNANSFFSHAPDNLKRNQAGFTVGLPIIKNKLFAFGGIQWLRIRQAAGDSRSQTLTAAERAGNFSQAPVTIYDPTNGSPFPNQQIPSARFSPAALSILKWSPLPDLDGFTRFSFPNPDEGEQYVGRWDYIHSDKHTFFVRYFDNVERTPFQSPPMNLHAVRNDGFQETKNGSVGWNYVISPTMLAHTQFSANHSLGASKGDFDGAITDFGINLFGPSAGGVSMALTGSGVSFNADNKAQFSRATFELVHDWAWTKEKHSFTFGTEIARKHFNNDTFFRSAGRYEFDGRGTSGPDGIGFDRADYMLGLMSFFQQNNGEFEQRRVWTRNFFVSDTWRVHPRVTLSLGLRFEPYQLFDDTRERIQFFDARNALNGVESKVFLNAPAGLYYPGDTAPAGYACGSTVLHAGTCPDWNNLAPRFGFAWDPFGSGKTSIRGGYAIFYDMPSLHILNDANNVAPFSYSVELNHSGLLLDDPYGGTLDDGSPARSLNRFPVSDFASDTPFAVPLYTIVAQNQYITPYSQNWSLTVEQEVFQNALLRVAYVGTKGTHLKTEYDANPAIYDFSRTLAQNRSSIDQRRRLHDFQEISQWMLGFNSTYHAMQMSFDKRYSSGFTVNLAYTWSKTLDYVSNNGFGGRDQVPNPFNFFTHRGLGDSHRPHRFVASYVWDLPSPADSGPVKAILGDWRFSGILTTHSGRPVNVNAAGAFVPGAGLSRADILGSGTPVLDTGRSKGEVLAAYFDKARFSNPAPGTYGTLGRNTFLGPGFGNFDMSLVKGFPLRFLGEGGRVEYRFEAFNLLNKTHLGQPVTGLTNSNFGKITGTDGDSRILQMALRIAF
jgi:hypothetical protein